MAVELTTFPSGLRVVSETMPQLETAAIGVWFPVGTRNEDADKGGLAHLVEHMLFKGTKKRSALQISEEIESRGGHTNAYTSREHTAYYARVLAADAELAVDILSDIVLNPVFDPVELEREKQVIIQEIGQTHDTPDDIIFDHLHKSAYGDDPLGRPILGRPEIILRAQSADLESYRKRYYGSNNMVLAASGKIDHRDLVRLAEKFFGGMEKTDTATPVPSRFAPTPQLESRDLEQCHVTLGFPACGASHDDFYAYSVYSTLLGGSSSSRLFQEAREKLGLAYSIYSFLSYTDDCGFLGVYAGTGPDQVGKLAEVVRRELLQSLEKLGESEIARAKQQLKASLLMSLEQPFSRAEQAAQQLLTYGRIVPLQEMLDKLDAVDAAALQKILSQSLSAKPALAAIGAKKSVKEWGKFKLSS